MPFKPRLTPAASKLIDARIAELFERLSIRLLGGGLTGKRLYVSEKHPDEYTLPGVFEVAANIEGGEIKDPYVVEGAAEVARDYIKRQEAQAKASTKRAAQALLMDVHEGRVDPEDFQNHLETTIWNTWDKVFTDVERIVATELNTTATMGQKEALDNMAEKLNIEDPVYVFYCVHDSRLCDECRRLHLCPDNITPRAWYSSEVSSAYHDRNENVPSWLGLHPWERCVPAMIMPGFGFNDDGKVSFVATGFSELEYQRAHDEPPRGVEARREWFEAVEKSEMEFGEPLEKANHVPLRQKDFLRLIERFGWRIVGDNAHKSQAKHSVSGQTFRGFSHSDPSVLPPQKVKYYLGQLGMAAVPSPRGEAKFVARRGHPHEQFYRKVPGLTEDDFS